MLERLPRSLAARLDPLGWSGATAAVAGRAVRNPAGVAAATGRWASRMARIPVASAQVLAERDVTPPMPLDPRDRRFDSAAWHDNPAFFALRQSYLATSAYLDDLVVAGAGDPLEDGKARKLAQLLVDLCAPTNIPVTNPAVLVRAFETGGASVVRGSRLAAQDLLRRGGRPLKVDRDAFVLGADLAATPGKVVFRNDLIELIQYEPHTAEVHETPILINPPWINKYYIADLAPGRSFVEWALGQGRSVFAISYRNPDESMRDATLEDYLQGGPGAAVDAVAEICGSDRVDLVAICAGGALATMLAAYLAAGGEGRIGTLTLINTLLDYSEPGEMGFMTDPETLERVEVRTGASGFLAGRDLGDTFDLLRANDLIFNYWVSRWMQGERPDAFDILAWNEDSIRIPGAMHCEYLRALYRDNQLAKGEFERGGRTLALSDVGCDTYVVGAINDHIVPWESSYATVGLMGGEVRFALSNGGHIAGIVNPPGDRSWYEVVGGPGADEHPVLPADAAAWRDAAERRRGSWWEDWASWSSARAGATRKPPRMGSEHHPVLGEAPGTYVRE
ncbi:PHA/PHB synthase family protein [Rhodococcus daqingensis]|uniref:PHA/PHB synthase family protein n=1 Tax=Rhodococcus daqingensis TaxID=2479363 RepID=A0ABW2RRB7_9NOCA